MKKTIAFISLAAAVLAACNKQEANPTPEVHYLKASSADETKTSLNFNITPVPVLWSENDKLAIYSQNSDLYEYTLSAGKGTTSGTFAHTGDVDFKGDQSFSAIFPSSMKTEKSANPAWPSVQLRHVYYPEQVDTPMYGEGTIDSDGNLSEVKLHNLGGVLKVTATFPSDRGQVYIKTVVISTTDVISGQFTINGNKAVPIQENGEHCIQLNCDGNYGKGVDCAAGSNHDFVFAVPASDENGYNFFTISFFDDNGKLYAQKHMHQDSDDKWLVIEQGKITTLSLNLTAPRAISVAADKKVVFAPGNLMVTSDGKFAFDFDPNGKSAYYWSQSADVATASTYSDPDATVNDILFTNNSDFLINGVHWRALTSAEWDYLLKRDTDPGNVYSCGGAGMYIYSDGYQGGKDSGQVFLPFTQETETSYYAFYWTADAYNRNNGGQVGLSQKEQAVAFNFSSPKVSGSSVVDPDSVVPRGNAHAIRLVVDVK